MTHGRTFDELALGDVVSFTRRFDVTSYEAFASTTGDRNPLHRDTAYASATTFGVPVVPLFLAASPFSAIAGMGLPGVRSLILESTLRPVAPTPYDTDLVYSGIVVDRSAATRTIRLRVLAAHGRTVVVDGRMTVQVRDDGQADADTDELPVERATEARRALILGGTGAIGSAIGRALAKEGWELLIQHRPAGRKKAEALAATLATDVVLVEADLADATGASAVAEHLRRSPVLTVVHSASPPVHDTTATHVAVGHDSLVAVAHAALPEMLRRQQGNVILIGSTAVHHPPGGWEAYVAAKSASSSFVDSLHVTYAPYGISATTVAPSRVLSAFSAGLPGSNAASLLPEEVAEAVLLEIAGEGGGYVALEPGLRRRGRFGFVETVARPPTAPPLFAASANVVANDVVDDDQQLDRLVRRYIEAGPGVSLAGAGVGVTPGWNSLAQIEILLAVESELGIQFSATELDETSTFDGLRRLVGVKRHRA